MQTKRNRPDAMPQQGRSPERQAMAMLLEEMKALAAILPAATAPARSDAEIEADFDNMPV